jgi:hypothetical protein
MRDDHGNRTGRPVRTYAGLDAACKLKDGLPHSGGWFVPDYRIPGDGSTAFRGMVYRIPGDGFRRSYRIPGDGLRT